MLTNAPPTHTNNLAVSLNPSNEERVASLCEWIVQNCDNNITWKQLTEQSNLSHSVLIHLFKVHRNTSPMVYVRRCIKDNYDKSHPTPQIVLSLFPD